MNIYIWEDVLEDYTAGVIICVDESLECAIKNIKLKLYQVVGEWW